MVALREPICLRVDRNRLSIRDEFPSALSRFNLRVVVVADVARLRGILERTEFWRIRLP